MIRSYALDIHGNGRSNLSVDQFIAVLQDQDSMLWVDFENSLPEEDEPLLRQVFGFHPLAIDDALQETHIPKVDDWGSYLYIVLNAVDVLNSSDQHFEILELDVFLGRNFLVTHHDRPILAVDRVWSSLQREIRVNHWGADHLLYKLVDELASSFMHVVDALDDRIDETEALVFDRPAPDTLEQIFSIKRAVLQLRRIIGPPREVLNKLARDDSGVIDHQDRIYFRDVYDHMVRLYDISESIRDLVSGVLDTYLSVINNRMNDIMKTLTIITTLFMPISFVTGFFGMNFFEPVASLYGWTSGVVFVVTLLVMLLAPITMVSYMQRRGWFG